MADKKLGLKYLGIPLDVKLDHNKTGNNGGLDITNCKIDLVAGASSQCTASRVDVVLKVWNLIQMIQILKICL